MFLSAARICSDGEFRLSTNTSVVVRVQKVGMVPAEWVKGKVKRTIDVMN
jgi:hypothetical protein